MRTITNQVLQVFIENEHEPFAVLRAKELQIDSLEEGFEGSIDRFFPLMGKISPMRNPNNHMVLCWLDWETDLAYRLRGVKFTSVEELTAMAEDKPLYEATFSSEKSAPKFSEEKAMTL